MKKQDLKQLIKESVKSALNENFLTESPKDPTKEEMVQFLTNEFGRMADDKEGFRFDMEGAIYWFANHYHGGQWSNLYSALSTSQFRPGAASRGPEKDSMEEDMYKALEAEYGGQEHQHGTEPHHPGEGDEWTALQEREEYDIPCPQCGEKKTYIDNPSHPTIYSCSKCKHRWNPDNEQAGKEVVLKYLDNGYYILSQKQAKEFAVDGQLPRPGYEKKADISKLKGLQADYRGQIRPLDVSDEDSAWIHQTPTWGKQVWAVRIHKKALPMREGWLNDVPPSTNSKGVPAHMGAKAGFLDNPNYGDELATDTSLASACCGAPPMGSVSNTNDGECSKCGEMTTFSPTDVSEQSGTGAAGGQGGPGAPGTGMGNVTANVDPIRTPHAFSRKGKHPKDVPAQQNEGNSEDDEALYVEYVGQMRDEEPFMLGGQKFEYVQAKYPSGKVDIGVYAFAGDVVYGYQAFRQMHNIKESEITDPSTGEVAPGPRDRFYLPKERKPVPSKVNKAAVKKALAAIGPMKNHEWRPLLDRARKNYQLFPDDGSDPVKLNLVLALQYMDEHPEEFGKEPLRESVVPKRIIKLKDLLK